MKTPLLISFVQQWNEQVYGAKNHAGFGALQLAVRLFMRAGFVSKTERKANQQRLRENLAISFSWLCAIANHLKVDLEAQVWEHYPFKCPYCTEQSCMCDRRPRPKKRAILPGHGIVQESQFTMGDLQAMFKYIYPRNTLEGSIRHLLEETAELAEQLDLLARGDTTLARFAKVLEEMVDVLANLFAVANTSGIKLDQAFAEVFEKGCCTCRETPCNCPTIAEEQADTVPEVT